MSLTDAAVLVTWWWALDADQLVGEGASSQAALDDAVRRWTRDVGPDERGPWTPESYRADLRAVPITTTVEGLRAIRAEAAATDGLLTARGALEEVVCPGG